MTEPRTAAMAEGAAVPTPATGQPAAGAVLAHQASPPPDAGYGRIRSVDGLRATAFLLVFAFHTWEVAGHPYIPLFTEIIRENTRVDLFIVLTGFCLFLPFVRDPLRAKTFRTRNYLRRRLCRIVLPYYAALLFAIGLPFVLKFGYKAVGMVGNPQPMPGLGDILTHLTFTHLFFVNYWASVNGSLWTMSLEMQFYLIFPVLLFLTARFGWRALAAAAIVSIVFRMVVSLVIGGGDPTQYFLWTVSGLGRSMEFAAGMAAATLAVRWREIRGPSRVLLLAACVVGPYVIGTLAPQSWVFPTRETLLGLAFGALIILAVTTASAQKIFSWRPLCWLGFMAYSLFLVHQPIAWYISQLLTRGVGLKAGIDYLLVLWALSFAVVLMVGYALHVLVERPCIRWSHRARPGAP